MKNNAAKISFLTVLACALLVSVSYVASQSTPYRFPFLDVTGDITVGGTVDTRDVSDDGDTLDNHVANASNPHTVTAAQLNLDNVPNIDWSVTGPEQVHADRYSSGSGGATNTVVGANGVTNTGNNTNAVLEPVYGTTANTLIHGNDARLSDARTPLAHLYSSHTGAVPAADLPAATTTTQGAVELATDGESAANLCVQANDARLSDARAPTAHNHNEADILDLGAYPDATGQAGAQVAQTDGLGGWTFIATPAGGGGSGDVTAAATLTADELVIGDGSKAVKTTGVTAASVSTAITQAGTATQPGDLGNSAGLDVGTTTGTVAAGDDSRFADVAANTSKLAGIEPGATADQTAGEIEAIVSHDLLQDYVAAEHINWSVTGAEDVHADRLPAASTTVAGIVELATDGEAIAGVCVQGDDARLASAATALQSSDIGSTVQAWDTILDGTTASFTTAKETDVAVSKAKLLSVSSISAFGASVIDDPDAATARTTLGLGTAATKAFGTSANQLVELDGTGKLPAVDGSALTGISGGSPHAIGGTQHTSSPLSAINTLVSDQDLIGSLDARLTDERVPTDDSVTLAKFADGTPGKWIKYNDSTGVAEEADAPTGGGLPASHFVEGTPSTTNATDTAVQIVGATVTPTVGTYVVTWSVSFSTTSTNQNVLIGVFKNAVQEGNLTWTAGGNIANARRSSSGTRRVTVNGTDTVNLRFTRLLGSATVTAHDFWMTLVQVAP